VPSCTHPVIWGRAFCEFADDGEPFIFTVRLCAEHTQTPFAEMIDTHCRRPDLDEQPVAALTRTQRRQYLRDEPWDANSAVPMTFQRAEHDPAADHDRVVREAEACAWRGCRSRRSAGLLRHSVLVGRHARGHPRDC